MPFSVRPASGRAFAVRPVAHHPSVSITSSIARRELMVRSSTVAPGFLVLLQPFQKFFSFAGITPGAGQEVDDYLSWSGHPQPASLVVVRSSMTSYVGSTSSMLAPVSAGKSSQAAAAASVSDT